MLSFTSFPPPSGQDARYSSTRYHPGTEDTEDEVMDVDDELENNGTKLISPGESITSAHAYMR